MEELHLPSLFCYLGHSPSNIPSLSPNVTKAINLITKKGLDSYLFLKSLTYSSIAPRRKSYLNVCFYKCFLHRWYCVIIGTKTLEENNWYLFIKLLYIFSL
jgi:hypothetical protein